MGQKSIINLVFLLAASSALAQTAYDKKLQSLYKETVPLIRAQELDKQLRSQKILVLDSRSPEEYNVSHIEGAQFIDYDRLNSSSFDELDMEATIVVYCTVGYRSERVGEKLQKEGFQKVYNLYGGVLQWANEGRPVVNSKGLPTDSVHTYSRHWSQWLQNGIKVYP